MEGVTYNYIVYGTTTLFAALDVATVKEGLENPQGIPTPRSGLSCGMRLSVNCEGSDGSERSSIWASATGSVAG